MLAPLPPKPTTTFPAPGALGAVPDLPKPAAAAEARAPGREAEEEPSSKRQRTDGLMLEEDFLAANPAEVTLSVQMPSLPGKYEGKLSGQTLRLSFQLTDKISMVKAKLQAEVGIPPGKQTIKVGTTTLNNVNSLAFYNIGAGQTMVLTEKTRGGRK